MRSHTKNWLVRKRHILLSAILFTSFITFISLKESEDLPQYTFAYIDKVFHVLAYVILVLLWSLSVKLYRSKSRILKILIIVFIALLFYGIIIESLQSKFTSSRTFEFYDLIANVFGMLIGAFIFKQFFSTETKYN